MSKSDQTKQLFEFGEFRLDTQERQLTANGRSVALTPKVFDLLVILLQNPGRLLEKNWLLSALWPGTFVEEANLSVNISTLRKALGTSGERFIETVPKRGYRFVGVVRDLSPAPAETTPVPSAPANLSPLTSAKPGRWPLLMLIGILALAIVFLIGERFWFRSVNSVSEVQSLAVLPFRTLAPGPHSQESETLGIGMADAVIRKLSVVQKITVRATSSVQKFSDAQLDPIAAGRELRVDVVLDGKVQQDGKMIRVSVQLLRVNDGAAIWADRFDDYYTNLFQVQDSLSEKVANALKIELTQDDQRKMTKHGTQDTLAYQLYLKGKYCAMKRTADAPAEACVALFEAAVAKDPEFALAYAGVADMYMEIASMEAKPAATEKARIAATKAITLDTSAPEAHLALGNVMFRGDWDWLGSRREFDRALALDTNSSLAHWNISLLLMALHHTEPALSEMEKAQLLDPASQTVRDDLGWAYYCNRRYSEAIKESKAAVAMDLQSYGAHHQLGKAYLQSGRFLEAQAEFETTMKLDSSRRGFADLGQTFALTGRIPDARRVLADLRRTDPATTYEAAYMLAVLEASLGDTDASFISLQRAVSERLSRAVWMRVDPDLDPLRRDPRFDVLLRRVHLLD